MRLELFSQNYVCNWIHDGIEGMQQHGSKRHLWISAPEGWDRAHVSGHSWRSNIKLGGKPILRPEVNNSSLIPLVRSFMAPSMFHGLVISCSISLAQFKKCGHIIKIIGDTLRGWGILLLSLILLDKFLSLTSPYHSGIST